MTQKIIRRWGLIILVVLVIGGSFIGGFAAGQESKLGAGYFVPRLNAASEQPSTVDFSSFWRVWKIVDEKFVDASATSSDNKRVWGAINGMLRTLDDPYTVFLPPAEKKTFEENINGNFGGVGIEIDSRDQILTVVSALDDTPAKAAGLMPNDKIIKIDQTSAENMSIDEAVSLIRGQIGTTVLLTIARSGEAELLEFTITRAKISIPTLKTELKDGVFIIKLYNFSTDATNAFRDSLRKFIASDTDKLVLDLRGNPGGFLEAAVDLASWFLPAGQPVVIERGRGPANEKVHRSYGYDIFTDQLKLVILVDGGSASAAEILAGALSEYGKGTLVGERTFGKGSVQELVDIGDDSSLKITIAKWYTPKGVSLSDNGLEPEIIVESSVKEEGKEKEETQDAQLVKAIEILQRTGDRVE